MKKRIIISINILLVAAGAIFGGNYFLSFREVSFDFTNSGSGSVYSSEDKLVAEIRDGDTLSMQPGNYYVTPTGENIAHSKTNFEVKNIDVKVSVHTSFTKEYLDSLLKSEIASIKAAAETKYPELMPGFELTSGKLYGHGEWYGGLLKPKVSSMRDLRDPYKIILHKTDGKWEVVRRPEYILTSSRYSQVPIEILRDINSLAE